jgi:flavodoxin
MKILVAYYSWQGHTQKVATALAQKLDAELVKIEAVSECGMFGKAMRAALGWKSPIKPTKTDLSGTDLLVIATPVWAGKVPPYINAYCAAITNCAGKPFAVLAEMGGSGADKAIAHVRGLLEKKGMRFVYSAVTVEKDVDAGTFAGIISAFAEKIAQP